MEPIQATEIEKPGPWAELGAGATRWLAVALALIAAVSAIEGAGADRDLDELWFQPSWTALALALGAGAVTWLGLYLGRHGRRWARWPIRASAVALIAAFSPAIGGLILGALVVGLCLYALWDEYIA